MKEKNDEKKIYNTNQREGENIITIAIKKEKK
jgi:hypothetical protein